MNIDKTGIGACRQQKTITCWVSRPYEKTVLVRYMLVLTYLCILVGFIELWYMLTRSGWKGVKRMNLVRKIVKSGVGLKKFEIDRMSNLSLEKLLERDSCKYTEKL